MAQQNQTITYPVIGVLIALLLFFCGLLWFVASPIIGKVYAVFRTIETFGAWTLTGYGRYFWAVPKGEQYEFNSIFWSSVPFGLLNAGLILVLGLMAKEKIATKHINAKITHKNPPTPTDIMAKMAPLFPHNEFFLSYPMHRYAIDRGPTAMPLTALELLMACRALEFEADSQTRDELAASTDAERISFLQRSGGAPFIANKERLRDALKGPFGPKNPFLGINLRDPAKVQTAIDALPWYAAIILYAAFARINALVGGTSQQFDKALADIDDFMRDVWREINAAKRKEGDRLMIGPFEIEEERPNEALEYDLTGAGEPPKPKAPEKKAPKVEEPIILLSDYLREHGPKFQTTATARRALLKIITTPAASLKERNVTAATRIEPGLTQHGFVFGVLASALIATRSAGVFPPNLFLWLRYTERPMWRFLTFIGMDVTCPEAAGMFAHWRLECAAGVPRILPEIDDAVLDGIVREARKYTPSGIRLHDYDDIAKAISAQSQSAVASMQKAADRMQNQTKTQ